MTVIKQRKKAAITNDFLLDIGINMDALAGDELMFHNNQISEIVDVNLKYVAKKEFEFSYQQTALQREA